MKTIDQILEAFEKEFKDDSLMVPYYQAKTFLRVALTEALKEKIKEIKTLCTHFPVRESDEFDDGRESMKREVLEILNK